MPRKNVRARRGAISVTQDRTPLAWLPWAIAFTAFLIYVPSFRGGFIWDDDLHLLSNPVLKPGGLARAWFSTEQTNYWPLTWSGFCLQWQLFGPNPTGYRFVNALLHAANSALIAIVLARLGIRGAYAAAALFAIHPLNVEAVAWVTQFKTLLCTLLFLLSLRGYLVATTTTFSRPHYRLSIAAFAFALLSKPAVVGFPVVLLLVEWWQRRTITRQTLLRTAPYFAVALATGLLEIWFQNHRSMAGVVVRTDSFLSRLLTAACVFWFYIWKTFIPYPLMFVYPRWTISPANAMTWLPLIACIALAAILFLKRNTWGRAPLFALGFYTVMIAPVLGFLNIFYMRYSFVADHWQYVAMPGIVALIAAGIHVLADRTKKNIIWLIAAVCAVLAMLTLRHQRVYMNIETLYHDTVAKNPRAALAHNNLASLLYRRGDMEGATRHYQQALAVDDLDPEAHAGYGNILFDQGRLADALEQYKAALPLMPAADKFKLHFEIAETYARLGHNAEAAQHFREVLRLRPDIVRARERLEQLTGAVPQ